MLSEEVRDQVDRAFAMAGYAGPLQTAPVTSDDERVFLISGDALRNIRDVGDLNRQLATILRRKVWIIAATPLWPEPVRFE